MSRTSSSASIPIPIPRVDPDTTGQVAAISSGSVQLEEEVKRRTEAVKKRLREVRRHFSPPAGMPAVRIPTPTKK